MMMKHAQSCNVARDIPHIYVAIYTPPTKPATSLKVEQVANLLHRLVSLRWFVRPSLGVLHLSCRTDVLINKPGHFNTPGVAIISLFYLVCSVILEYLHPVRFVKQTIDPGRVLPH